MKSDQQAENMFAAMLAGKKGGKGSPFSAPPALEVQNWAKGHTEPRGAPQGVPGGVAAANAWLQKPVSLPLFRENLGKGKGKKPEAPQDYRRGRCQPRWHPGSASPYSTRPFVAPIRQLS